MRYYHITKERNLQNILAKGILPGSKIRKKGLTARDITQTFVFVTTDVDRIVKSQAGTKWCKRWNPIVIEVNLDEKEVCPVQYHCHRTYTVSDFEFIVNSISPNKIVSYCYLKDYVSLVQLV